MQIMFNGANPLESCVGCITCSGCLGLIILIGVPSIILAIGAICRGFL